MNVFRKMSAALVAIASLTAADHAMAACSASWQGSWFSGPSYPTLTCVNRGASVNLANFFFNATSSSNKFGTVNLTGGTSAQIYGLTQGGAYVSGCSADDFTAGGNTPVYLNWNGNSSPNCSQASLVRLYAETFR